MQALKQAIAEWFEAADARQKQARKQRLYM